jgi:hypothetical protein
MGKTVNALSPELVHCLQGEKIVSCVTVNAEHGKPDLDVISWVLAGPGGDQIKIAVGHKATIASNIEKDPSVILGIIGLGSCYAVKGKAEVSEIVEKTMKFRVVTVQVESVEDIIFYGGKITVEPEYVKTYDKELAEKLDREIYGFLADSFAVE